MESREVKAPLADKTVIKYRGIKSLPLILGNETFEKLGTTGTLVNMVVYLTSIFNLKSVTATLIINVFSGITDIAPLVGAFLSDTHFRRYNVMGFASICSFCAPLADRTVIKYRGIKSLPFILGNETFEKLGTIGTLVNMVVYLTSIFNLKSVTATLIINVFSGITNIAPLVGAFLSDTYFGRYNVLGFASICSFLGMAMITMTSRVPNLHPPICGESEISKYTGPTIFQLLFLLSGFGFIVIGAGGVRPCALPFALDQFNPNTESGKRAIKSFFNWYFFTFTFAVMISFTLIAYVQSEIGWSIGLAIPTGLMFLSCFVFFVGTKLYVIIKPEGSPLANIAQVLVAFIRKRRLSLPDQSDHCLFNYEQANSMNFKISRTDQFRFLERCAIITNEDGINNDGSAANPWRLCSIQQVEEVKCVLRVVPILISAIVYYAAILLQPFYVPLQALQSDRRIGTSGFHVPAASLIVFAMVGLTLWIPIYDRVVVPFLFRFTGKEGGITILQRMGIGIVLSILSTLVSAWVEDHRRHLALTKQPMGFEPKKGAVSSMSALWLIPQLVITGIADAFFSIGHIEFYYKQFPENMRTIANAFPSIAMAVSNFLTGFLISAVHNVTSGSSGGDWLSQDLNKGKLHYFYYTIAALGIVNLGYFLVCASLYQYKQTPGNDQLSVEANRDQLRV